MLPAMPPPAPAGHWKSPKPLPSRYSSEMQRRGGQQAQYGQYQHTPGYHTVQAGSHSRVTGFSPAQASPGLLHASSTPLSRGDHAVAAVPGDGRVGTPLPHRVSGGFGGSPGAELALAVRLCCSDAVQTCAMVMLLW